MTAFDPRLQIEVEIADCIAVTCFGPEPIETVITSEYLAALTRDWRDGQLVVRAATGAEVEALLSTGGVEPGDTLRWPQDTPTEAGVSIVWAIGSEADRTEEPAVILWTGEVLFRDGQGVAGPFFVYRQAAMAWAFATALDHEPHAVFCAQVIPHHCARSLAPGLLTGTEADVRRLLRYEPPALRPVGTPQDVPLPPFHFS